MSEKISETTDTKWFYVVIQNPGTGQEQYMGFKQDDIQNTFIPAFATKEEAQQCFLMMPKDIMHNKYEVQAVMEDELISVAGERGFHVYIMDDKGRIKRRLDG